MIKRIRHKGLKLFYEQDKKSGIKPEHANRLRLILSVLDAAREPHDLNSPALGLHPLQGDLKGYYALWVSGNWRVTFRFDGRDVTDVNYLDYH
jgi:proteic killer suppression protein